MKFLTQNTGDRIRDLEKYAKPGGFDFWHGAREGVSNVMRGSSKSEARNNIQNLKAEKTIPHNLEVFDAVVDWLSRQSGVYFQPEKLLWTSPQQVFSVHIEAEIGLEAKDGTRSIIAVYPSASLRLNRDIGGAGAIMLRYAYQNQDKERVGILDARVKIDDKYGKVFWSPTNLSKAILDEEINRIESTLQRIFF